ncbi:MAG: uroporphyrinogen-III synthase [Robiginitalea sp.]|nr:uroporphyrinogen-III synthase [Robiginitalea sp.]
MKRLLSTKILPEPLQARILAAGWKLTQYNAISIELLPVEFSPGDRLAIFTSKQAVRACLAGSPDTGLSAVSCLCVGAGTAALIRDHAGVVLESASSATELASRIAKKYTDKSFVYYCGNRRLDVLPETLDKLGLDWQEVIAYRTNTVDQTFDQTFDGILFYSPSGVESFTGSNAMGGATAYCIGPTTAAEAKKHTEKYKLARSPDLEALMALVIQIPTQSKTT